MVLLLVHQMVLSMVIITMYLGIEKLEHLQEYQVELLHHHLIVLVRHQVLEFISTQELEVTELLHMD